MKRYNIHIPQEWIPQLQKIRTDILKTGKQRWFWESVSCADLIRFAIAHAFNLADPGSPLNNPEVIKAVNRVVKFRPWPGRQYK